MAGQSLKSRLWYPWATKQRRRRTRTAYLFMAPSLIVLGVFMVYPLLRAGWLSLTNYSFFGGSHFVGLANYRSLLHDSQFWRDLLNTFYYAGVVTPVSVVLALALALLLNRKGLPGRGFFRAAIFLPAVVSFAVSAIAFRFMFAPSIGFLTYWLAQIGINVNDWLDSVRFAMPAVILVGIWKNVGFYMVIFLAGLQTIPKELYEAASIDGATRWRRFVHVTIPLLSNTSMFVTVIALIASLQAFDQIYVMTQGGPAFSTETLVMLIYREGFTNFQMGYASAIAYVLMALVLLLSLVQLRFFSRRVVKY